MRLGVVMTGTPAQAAAGLGVLRELGRRGIEPHAVCGLMGGAWPAALYTAGLEDAAMERAAMAMARIGERIYTPRAFSAQRIRHGAIGCAHTLERLLVAQAGQRMLALCPRTGVFLCRAARTGQRVVFSSRAMMQEPGMMLGMQVSVSFAARAAMTLPPFLAPMEWMGSLLLPQTDAAQACRALLSLGAQRILVIRPQILAGAAPDAVDLTCMSMECTAVLPPEACMLTVPVPAAGGFSAQLPACLEAGERAAKRELDAVFLQLGMAFCRILPFRRCGL